MPPIPRNNAIWFGNPGGNLTGAVYISDCYVKESLLAELKDGDKHMWHYFVPGCRCKACEVSGEPLCPQRNSHILRRGLLHTDDERECVIMVAKPRVQRRGRWGEGECW